MESINALRVVVGITSGVNMSKYNLLSEILYICTTIVTVIDDFFI